MSTTQPGLAWILAAVLDHGEGPVGQAIEQALQAGRQDLLALAPQLHGELKRAEVPVPEALRKYSIEAGRAADYDALLVGGEA